MNIIFFDSETTGKPINYNGQMQDLENWPRVIQLAWQLANAETGEVLTSHELLVKPDGWVIPVEKFWIDNGFSTEKNEAEGIPMPEVLDKFISDLNNSDVMVAHNLGFDYPIVGAEMIRYNKKSENAGNRAKMCTMATTVNLCKIPFPGARNYGKRHVNFKWPKMEELYKFLFNQGFEGAHQAGSDVTACRLCFFELVKRGHLTIPQIVKP